MKQRGGEPYEPIQIYTHGANRQHFEKYKRGQEPHLADDDFESVRQEIAKYYGIPTDHSFFISDDVLTKQRTRRAFSIVILPNAESFYIDGRTAHSVLLRTLQNTYRVPFDPEGEEFVSVNGFVDPEGFPDVPDVQKKAKELKRPITWFVRYTTSSPSSSSPPPVSPVEIG